MKAIDYDTVVVGAGVMGSATAYCVARSGKDTLLLERFGLRHNRGSSHGASRIFRLSYPDEMYVRMAQDALVLWRQAEAESGRELVQTLGGVDLGVGIDSNRAALEACGARHEILDRSEAGRRFPMISFGDGPVLFQPDSGIVHAERALEAFRDGARAAGAVIRDQATVTHLELDGDSALVRVGQETIRARVVVITAGAWGKELLHQVGYELDVRPTRETIAYFGLGGPVPPTLVEWGEPAAYSLLDPRTGGLKVGEHIAGPTTDPTDEGVVDQGSVARIAAWVTERFPSANPAPTHSETCIYTNTPDEHFVLERTGPFVVGSPCSGHGFKFAPLIGERLAALASQ